MPASRRPGLASPVRAISSAHSLVIAVPSTRRRAGVAAGHVDAGDPAVLVGVRAEGDVHRLPGDEVRRRGAVADRPHALGARRLTVVDRMAPGGAELDAGGLGQLRARHADAEHDEVGVDRAVRRQHRPGLEALDPDPAADVDAVTRIRLGDPPAEVGVDDAERLRPCSTTVAVQPRSM